MLSDGPTRAAARPASNGASVPLVVDLDGTLIRSDMLLETLAAVLKRRPWLAFAVPLWLMRGRAALKAELAARTAVDPALLPYRAAVIEELRRERGNGRMIVLATATDAGLARGIAEHVGLFDAVIGSEREKNLKGQAKAQALVERFGERGYDFMADGDWEFPSWRHARAAMVVSASGATVRRLEAAGVAVRRVPPDAKPALTLLRALRAYQWAKNLLVFVPLVTAHKVFAPGALTAAVLAFVAFSLVASAVYVANDLADLEDDRRHATKRARMLAAGHMGIGTALLLVPALLVAAATAALLLPPAFGGWLLLYVGLNLVYSLGVKRVVVLDVLLLAMLYTLRILAGASAVGVPVSQWLLAFSLFAFFSLALAKRYVEVRNSAARDQDRIHGRGYRAHDGPFLAMLGTASGLLSVLVFSLYVTSREVVALYAHPALLWFAVPLLLYGIAHVWFIAQRGELHEDPLLFALHDPASYATAACLAIVMLAAT